MEVYGNNGPQNLPMNNMQGGNGNQFMQNKYQFATYYGQKSMLGNQN